MAPVNPSLYFSNLFRARRLVALTVLFCPQACFPASATCFLLLSLATGPKPLSTSSWLHINLILMFYFAAAREPFCYTDPFLY
ncbi:hypothetical protein C8R45DRAFT_1029690 [Mycena sanguinolenta]|nr:hypothetical protein C8R45DRAFT_1029690 [Mycena sanguinolenta]